MKRFLKILAFAILTAVLAACAAPPAEQQPQVFPTFLLVTQAPATPLSDSGAAGTSVWEWTPVPEYSQTPNASPTPIPLPTETPRPIPTVEIIPPTQMSSAPSVPFRPTYILYADMNFAARTLSVHETIQYYNATGTTLTDMTLAVQPNRWSNVFGLNQILQDNVPVTAFTLSDQRLDISLPAPLPPDSATTLTITFTLSLPDKGDGLFGYDFNQINLVDWYPFIVPYQNGWVLHDPVSFGEHLVYDAADIELNIKTDAGVMVAIGAPAEPNGEWTRYRISGARTLTLSASNEFLVKESSVGSVVIQSYYFSGYEAAADSILYSAKQAVSLFEAKFAPYPYQSLAIVQADIHDGMEYDGLVFISSKFYGQYGGGAKNNLTTIGVHEIAHQWWYGLVGNDHALEPWLDEALSAYSEKLFYEYNYPRYGDWWWEFRVDFFGPAGFVDSSIYSHSTFRSYTNAVYLNGAHFLDDLRGKMGDDAFFRFLKEYATRYARKHATTADFFNLVREFSSADLRYLMPLYFSGVY